MEVFKSKIDKWILVCFALSTLACVLGAWVAIKVGGTANYVFAAIILIGGAGFPLWILASTRYIVSDTELKIASGPFSWIIPIQSITSVQQSDSTITGPALSFDRLEIFYDADKSIIVSPNDPRKFIQKLGKDSPIVASEESRNPTNGKIPQTPTKKNKKNPKNI